MQLSRFANAKFVRLNETDTENLERNREKI